MKKAKKIFVRSRQWCWVAVQAFALLALLFFPLLIRQKSKNSTNVIADLSGGVRHVAVSTGMDHDDKQIENMAVEPNQAFQSEVLQVLGPESEVWKFDPTIYSTYAQVRFEFVVELDSLAGRIPADDETVEYVPHSSKKGSWVVTGFQRDLGGGLWEDLALLSDESGKPVSSTFVELDPGEQSYRVKFQNSESDDELVKAFKVVRNQ